MDNEQLLEKIHSLECDISVMKEKQNQQADDTKEIKEILKSLQKDKEDDVKWIKRQFLSIGIGILMTVMALGFGCYSLSQINQAKEIISQYQK